MEESCIIPRAEEWLVIHNSENYSSNSPERAVQRARDETR